MKKLQVTIWPALFWIVMTTVLLCLPGSALPVKNWFNKIWLDKWVHIGLFSILVFLWCRVISFVDANKMRLFAQVACCFFLYGIAMEFVQKYLIPNRSFDVGDIIADGVGCAVGLLFSARVYIKK